MKKPRIERHQRSTNARTLQNPVFPPLPEKLRRLVNASYAAHGGVEHMSLDQWRDLEQELKRRLENWHEQHQQ
jgi:hypothetical protein